MDGNSDLWANDKSISALLIPRLDAARYSFALPQNKTQLELVRPRLRLLSPPERDITDVVNDSTETFPVMTNGTGWEKVFPELEPLNGEPVGTLLLSFHFVLDDHWTIIGPNH